MCGAEWGGAADAVRSAAADELRGAASVIVRPAAANPLGRCREKVRRAEL